MKIDFSTEEVKKILTDKFGEGDFRVFYSEPEKIWEGRTGLKLKDLREPPIGDRAFFSAILYF